MPHCGSRTATSVECMPAGWPRPAPNTLEVLYGEIECIGTEGHGPALFMSLKRHYFANKTSIGKKTATFTRQPPTLSSLANDVGGQPLARCHTREKGLLETEVAVHTHAQENMHTIGKRLFSPSIHLAFATNKLRLLCDVEPGVVGRFTTS